MAREGDSCTLTHTHPPKKVAYKLVYGNVSVCYSGDTRPNAELLELCRGADLMILGMIGPFKDLAALTPTSQRLARTSHVTVAQAGPLLRALAPAPRLAVLHHLQVNDATRAPIVSGVRAGGYAGPLAVNEDGLVVLVAPGGGELEMRKLLFVPRAFGWYEGNMPRVLELYLASVGALRKGAGGAAAGSGATAGADKGGGGGK
jgi:hypothetical protein